MLLAPTLGEMRAAVAWEGEWIVFQGRSRAARRRLRHAV
jgi:hypothetical protein